MSSEFMGYYLRNLNRIAKVILALRDGDIERAVKYADHAYRMAETTWEGVADEIDGLHANIESLERQIESFAAAVRARKRMGIGR